MMGTSWGARNLIRDERVGEEEGSKQDEVDEDVDSAWERHVVLSSVAE